MMKNFVLVAGILVMLQIALAQSFQVLERTCEGNYLIAKVRETDGSIGYRILDYCPYGCKYGTCLSKKEVPVVDVKEIYKVKACGDNAIFISMTNIGGTKGDISLLVSGEAARWIRYPEKISMNVNETKTVVLVASIPCNVTSGIYPFTLVGSGVIDFYAPSALSIGEAKSSPLAITTTVTSLDVKIALIAAALLIFTYFAFRYSFRSRSMKREERFGE